MSAALIAKLAAAGLDPDLLGEVAMALATAQATTAILETRRAKDRERKSLIPRNPRNSVEPLESAEIPPAKECVSPTPPSQENLSPQKKTPPMGGQKKRASRLSDDWSLPEEGRAYAIARGVPAGKVEATADRFKNHWISKAGKDGAKLNWAATWRNWVLADCERYGWAPTEPLPPDKPPDEDDLRPAGAPSSAELRARYAVPAKAAPDDREDADSAVLRQGPGVHREGEAGRQGPVQSDQARRGRVEQLGDLLSPVLRLVAGGNAGRGEGDALVDDRPRPVAGMVR